MENQVELPRSARLNEVQLMLLRLFDRGMSREEIAEIRTLLMDHLHKKLARQVEADIERKGITREDFERVLNQSQRTPQVKKAS